MSWERNQRFVAKASVSEIAAALLAAMEKTQDAPLVFDPEVPFSMEVRSLFQAQPNAREKLKEGIIAAIHQWTIAHRGEGLRQLALSAAYTRAADSVSPLARILDSGRIREFRTWKDDPPEIQALVTAIVRVVAGFAPLPVARVALERWLHEPRFQRACAGVIAASLCACEPSAYQKYLTAFWTIATQYREAYDVDGIVREIIRTVGAARVGEDLDAYTDDALYGHVIHGLAGYHDSPATLDLTRQEVIITDSALTIRHDPGTPPRVTAAIQAATRRIARQNDWVNRLRTRARIA